MDEFDLIEKLFQPLAAKGALNLKDDAALLSPPLGMDLVLTKDAIVEDVHFRSDDQPGRIAQKLQRVNLSDLAAKGAVPLGYLLATAFRRDVEPAWLEDFAAGLGADQKEFGWELYGGDTVATPGPMMFSLTAIGTVVPGKMIRRAGAVVGDDVWVTGTIGDAGLGLGLLEDRYDLGEGQLRQQLVDRYHLPQPRTGFGPRLIDLATAAIDISDGLVADAEHLGEASVVGLDLDLEMIPVSQGARALISSGQVDRIGLVVSGDDYELLYTCPPNRRTDVTNAGTAEGLDICRIGRVRSGGGVRLLSSNGKEIPVNSKGYTHF